MHVKVADELPKEEIKAGKKTTRQVLIGPDQGPNFALRRFTIEPGGHMPLHTNTVEHEQYVLQGKAEIIIDDKNYQVERGSVVYIPANVKHSYKTIGEEAFEFLCIVPNKEDIIELAK